MKTRTTKSARIIRAATLMLAVLFLSLNLNAQLSANSYKWKKVATELLLGKEQINTALESIKIENAFSEEEILFEDWMTDLRSWARKADSLAIEEAKAEPKSLVIPLEAETLDENLELESWMMDAHWIEIENFEDEELKLESWMSSPENWKI